MLFEVCHPIFFFEGAAPVFLIQHHKLGHDELIFSQDLSWYLNFSLLLQLRKVKTFGSHGVEDDLSTLERKGEGAAG